MAASDPNAVPLVPVKKVILVVEDEAAMVRLLRDNLTYEGYDVLVATDGEAAVETALRTRPDLILLDIMLPKLDGFRLCAELRRLANSVPVLMLTAKGQIEDRVIGLDAGADDYLVKPFSTDELLARMRALLRRVERQTKTPLKLKLGEVEIDLARQTAMRGKKPVHLTAKEFAMLRLMAGTEGEPVSRERFLDAVWGQHGASGEAHERIRVLRPAVIEAGKAGNDQASGVDLGAHGCPPVSPGCAAARIGGA